MGAWGINENLGRNQAQSGGSSPLARRTSSLSQLQQSQIVQRTHLVPGVLSRWPSRRQGLLWGSVSGDPSLGIGITDYTNIRQILALPWSWFTLRLWFISLYSVWTDLTVAVSGLWLTSRSFPPQVSLVTNCRPATRPFRASSSHFFFLVVLLIGLALACVPVMVSIAEWVCGS